MVTSILQISKLRLSEVKSFGQLHKKLKCKRQSWDLNRGVHLWSTTPSKLFVCSYCLLNRELEGWNDLQQLYRPAILFCSTDVRRYLGLSQLVEGGCTCAPGILWPRLLLHILPRTEQPLPQWVSLPHRSTVLRLSNPCLDPSPYFTAEKIA